MTYVNMVIAGIFDVDTYRVKFGLVAYSSLSWSSSERFQRQGNFQIYIRYLQSTLRGFAVALKLPQGEENWSFRCRKKEQFSRKNQNPCVEVYLENESLEANRIDSEEFSGTQ